MKERMLYVWPLGSVFLLPGLFMVYIKGILLQENSGYLAISRYLGRQTKGDFSLPEQLSFFREDILICVLGLPLLLLLCVTCVPHRLRSAFSIVASLALLFAGFVSLLSVGNIGRFLTADMAFDSVAWAIGQPESIFDYASASSVTKLAVLCAFIVIGIVVVDRSLQRSGRIARWSGHGFGAALAIGTLLCLVGWSTTLNVSAAYRSAAYKIAATFLETSVDAGEFSHLGARDLANVYAGLSRTSEVKKPDALFGAAKGRDVLVFILETAPAAGADFSHLFAPGRPLHRLAGSTLISAQHYSTYPYTSDAMFSIFSSQYPLGRRQLIQSRPAKAYIGWPALLADRESDTRQYAPNPDTFEDDTTMYKLLGFAARSIAADHAATADPAILKRVAAVTDRFPNRDRARDASLEKRLVDDLTAWESLKRDYLDVKRRGKRLVFAYAPQIGHGPFFNLTNSKDVLKRGATLVELQMEWLAELVELMHRQGTLQNTLIVITGDHGVRTRTEYPDLDTGVLTGYSMNVPMALYAYGVFSGLQELQYPTSHIDIGPSLLWLLGIEDTRVAVHGAPMWQPELTDRVLYFFGRDYLGASGFYDRGQYVSCEYYNYTCRRGPSLYFEQHQRERADPATDRQWIEKLRAIAALQFGVTRTLMRKGKDPS